MCFLVNNQWCTDKVLSQFCSPDLETLTIKCRPFYLPREFSFVILTAVYIPPQTNAATAISQLSDIVTEHENSSPDCVSLIAGDFNKASLRKELPKYVQQVTCAARGVNIFDHRYSTIKNAFHSVARAPLGNSDHNMIHLVPSYKQQIKRENPVKPTVRTWTDAAAETLRGCLEDTDWGVFRDAASDIDEYTETVTDYIKFCENQCIPTKTIVQYPNDKPWFHGAINQKVKDKDDAFFIR